MFTNSQLGYKIGSVAENIELIMQNSNGNTTIWKNSEEVSNVVISLNILC